MLKKTILLAAAVVFISCGNSRSADIEKAFEGFKGNHVLTVEKRSFTLRVHDRRGKVLAEYRIGYGLNPDRSTKLHAGDNRTPEGEYRIIEILSMDAQPNSALYKKLSAMNRVYFRARDGHYKHGKPKVDLGDNAYGPRFFLLDYPAERDRKRYEALLAEGGIPRLPGGECAPIGHGIAIHGNNDESSIGHLSSSGCVRMFNNDIVELDKYLIIGTPVIIYSD